MNYIIQISLFVLGLLMFHVSMKYKLAIMIFSAICYGSVTVKFIPFGESRFFLSICFLLSELPSFLKHIREIRLTIILRLILIMSLGTFVAIIFSSHYHSITGVLRLIIMDLVGKYFVLAYAFVCIKKEDDLSPIFKIIDVGIILLTLFGLHNLLTKHSIWFDILFPEGTKDISYTGFENLRRFRVQSMFESPFAYGFICVWSSLFYLYQYYIKKCSLYKYAFYLFLCLFGIISCGCRTMLICWMLGYCFFFYYVLSKRKKLYLIFLSFFLIALTLLALPSEISSGFVEQYSLALDTDTTQGGDGMGGSSVGLRLLQFITVLSYLPGHWLFGNGVDFFAIDLGWNDRDISTPVDNELFGIEGVYLLLLLERGFVGFLLWIAFYSSLFYFFYKRKRESKIESAFGISILILYLSFAMMTGEILSVFPTLLALSLIIKIETIKESARKKKITETNKNYN